MCAVMERPALALSRVQPSPRAARKSEWLRSALAHHHCPDPGVDNEIVVLATGIDQYLQEVFHHLAYPNRDDTVSAEDFTALCVVLGLTGGTRTRRGKEGAGDGAKHAEDEEFRNVCSGLPCQLSFKDFHSRLCGYFRVRSARRGSGECAWRLPVTADTELVERQIRLRWPRVRRRKCVSFDLTRDQNGPVNRPIKGRAAEERESGEVAALRELVEDLRSALQGSDARCLALEVALRRDGRRTSPSPSPSSFSSTASSPTTSITLIQGKLVPTQRIKGQRGGAGGDGARRGPRRRDIRDPLLRELKLIRSSRDGQLEEAIKFNERLEEELRWAYREVRGLQGVESALRKENAKIRRRAEEAREALSLGLQRVRTIQEQAQSVPQLQSRITQLEAELHLYRSCCTCIPEPARQQMYPIGAEDACSKTEGLQRAVEGRAASDEEEEDRGMREEGECSLLEAKKPIGRLHGCATGCQNHVAHQMSSQSRTGQNQEQPEGSRGFEREKGVRPEARSHWERLQSPATPNGNKRGKMTVGQCKGLEQGDAVTLASTFERPEEEEDKTRLEKKLTDALTLLLQLRTKTGSRRVLGKTGMDPLDVCSRSGDGPSQGRQVADALCVRLSSGQRPGKGGDDDAGESRERLPVPSSGCHTSSVNPLLISC